MADGYAKAQPVALTRKRGKISTLRAGGRRPDPRYPAALTTNLRNQTGPEGDEAPQA
jgi:hypothetical protein